MSTNQWAALLAPILGVAIWKGFFWAAAKVHDYLWVHLPEGKLRKLLLRKVS